MWFSGSLLTETRRPEHRLLVDEGGRRELPEDLLAFGAFKMGALAFCWRLTYGNVPATVVRGCTAQNSRKMP